MFSRVDLSRLKSNFVLKDWMIALVGVLAVKECVTVSITLNRIAPPAGTMAAVAFSCIAAFVFGQLYTRLGTRLRFFGFLLVGFSILFIFGDGGSAHAQFLQNAEDFFETGAAEFGLGESINLLISLIFWLIRGAFVIGVAIALLPAIQAAREGEEWRSLAKTPMLVVGIVLAGATSVDFLTAGVGG